MSLCKICKFYKTSDGEALCNFCAAKPYDLLDRESPARRCLSEAERVCPELPSLTRKDRTRQALLEMVQVGKTSRDQTLILERFWHVVDLSGSLTLTLFDAFDLVRKHLDIAGSKKYTGEDGVADAHDCLRRSQCHSKFCVCKACKAVSPGCGGPPKAEAKPDGRAEPLPSSVEALIAKRAAKVEFEKLLCIIQERLEKGDMVFCAESAAALWLTRRPRPTPHERRIYEIMLQWAREIDSGRPTDWANK